MKFIVARWQEDVAWADAVDADVVQKGEHLPNVGREPSSFLWWILQHWNAIDPDESYAFVQGKPHDHWPNPLGLPSTVDTYTPLGVLQFRCDGNGAPHHPGVPVAECHERWLGPWPGGVTFWAGGQFAVPGRLILARDREWYRTVYADLMCREDSQLWPWALERLWPVVFGEGQ